MFWHLEPCWPWRDCLSRAQPIAQDNKWLLPCANKSGQSPWTHPSSIRLSGSGPLPPCSDNGWPSTRHPGTAHLLQNPLKVFKLANLELFNQFKHFTPWKPQKSPAFILCQLPLPPDLDGRFPMRSPWQVLPSPLGMVRNNSFFQGCYPVCGLNLTWIIKRPTF